VEPGQRVEPGQLLFVVEAMKMEHRITARTAGTVTAVLVAAGEQVAADQLLATLEDAQPHDDTGTDSRQDPPRSDR
jgi:biotin carboxyl carrier protein